MGSLVTVTEPVDLPTPSVAARSDDHAFAAWAATVAGELLTEVRGQGLVGKELKDAGDLAAHDLLMALCATYRPDDAVMSEESKASIVNRDRLNASRVWIIDPLDGTREFSEPPRDDWAVHVALWQDGELTVGAVAQPGIGDDLRHRPPADRAAAHGRAAPDRGQPHPPARRSSRASPRRWAPTWCRWAPPARR